MCPPISDTKPALLQIPVLHSPAICFFGSVRFLFVIAYSVFFFVFFHCQQDLLHELTTAESGSATRLESMLEMLSPVARLRTWLFGGILSFQASWAIFFQPLASLARLKLLQRLEAVEGKKNNNKNKKKKKHPVSCCNCLFHKPQLQYNAPEQVFTKLELSEWKYLKVSVEQRQFWMTICY